MPSNGGGTVRPEDTAAPGAGGAAATQGLGLVATGTASRQPSPLQNPTLAYLGSLSPNGRLAMRKRLRAVARLIGRDEAEMLEWWHRLTFQELEFIRGLLLERGKAPSTVNLTLAALKGVARYARDLGLLTAEEYDRIRRVKGARGRRLPPGRAAAKDEVRSLVAVCLADPGPAGLRDLAILAILATAGVRRAELAALAIDDYHPDPPRVLVRQGKGDKEREVPLNDGAAAAIERWLACRGQAPGKLFVRIDRWGNLDKHCHGMTTQAVYEIVEKRVAQAGLPPLSPHDFRRTFVGDLLDAGVDLSTVQQLAGHASPLTTARYDRRGEAAKRKAIALLEFPGADGTG